MQHATVPGPVMEFEEYEVQAGDTITSVAFKKKVNQRLLRKINHFLTEELMPGEILMVPILPEEDTGFIEKRFS